MTWRDDARQMTDADRVEVEAFREFLRSVGEAPLEGETVSVRQPEFDYANGAITGARYLELKRAT